LLKIITFLLVSHKNMMYIAKNMDKMEFSYANIVEAAYECYA